MIQRAYPKVTTTATAGVTRWRRMYSAEEALPLSATIHTAQAYDIKRECSRNACAIQLLNFSFAQPTSPSFCAKHRGPLAPGSHADLPIVSGKIPAEPCGS